MNLVTGATGLLGSHMIAELVRQGEKVRAFYRSEPGKLRTQKTLSYYFPDSGEITDSIEWVKGDVLDACSLAVATEGVKKVYHTAGIVSFGQVSKKKILKTNMQGTANLVNACLENPGIKLCHVSSIAALGTTVDGSLIDENCMLKPDKKTDDYSYSKFKGELEVWRGIHEGLQAVIVNPSVILGPGVWYSSTAAIIKRIYNGLSFYPAGVIGCVDVRDVASAMYRLMNSDINAERFILNSENLSFLDLFTLIAHEFGEKPPAYRVRPWMKAAAVTGDFVRALVTGTPRQITLKALEIADHRTMYSNEKIVRQTGIGFIPVKESVRFMCEMYLK
ncbi:MAG: NAD-dependent epimerase/dehydratase family protein [Bacteroidales bacterium]|nr:NAD-dependent epimerase/dehydratase family protein [Bacteroidales bacterium]